MMALNGSFKVVSSVKKREKQMPRSYFTYTLLHFPFSVAIEQIRDLTISGDISEK